MRPVISYDDIADPLSKPTNDTPTTGGAEQFGGAQLGPQLPSHHQPPTKRRRPNQSRPQPNQQNHNGRQQSHQNQRSQPRQPVQHWDEPGTSNLSMNYGGDEEEAGVDFNGEALDEEQGEEEEEEESRELTHEEIWDDSALIDAWNSASAEYEAYHGKGDQSWKDEPVKKSPLWYNIPPEASKKSKVKGKKLSNAPSDGIARAAMEPSRMQGQEADSQPLDFSTYVPTHDPSLAPLHPPDVPGPEYAQYYLPPFQGPMVNQDEAFQRALSAMYWGGYWTAVYHYQRQAQHTASQDQEAEEDEGDEEMQDEPAEEAEFVSTQR